MSPYQPDAEAGQPNPEGPPAFRVVRRGYDRDEVDAAFSQLTARLQQRWTNPPRPSRQGSSCRVRSPASGSGSRRSSRSVGRPPR
jgi:DivIVA domain-containing protein